MDMEARFSIRDSAPNGENRDEVFALLNFLSDGTFDVKINLTLHTTDARGTLVTKMQKSGAGTYTLSDSKVILDFTSKDFSSPEGNELNFLSSSMDEIEWQGIGMENGHVMKKY